jgi:hypothetical protein
MIKLQNKHLMDALFNNALIKLERHVGFPPRTTYDVMKIVRLIRQESQDIQKAFIQMVKKHATLDEQGECVPNKDENGKFIPGTFVVPDDKAEAYQAERKAFDELEFSLDWRKLKLSDLNGTKLSAQELAALEPLIEFDLNEETL